METITKDILTKATELLKRQKTVKASIIKYQDELAEIEKELETAIPKELSDFLAVAGGNSASGSSKSTAKAKDGTPKAPRVEKPKPVIKSLDDLEAHVKATGKLSWRVLQDADYGKKIVDLIGGSKRFNVQTSDKKTWTTVTLASKK